MSSQTDSKNDEASRIPISLTPREGVILSAYLFTVGGHTLYVGGYLPFLGEIANLFPQFLFLVNAITLFALGLLTLSLIDEEK